MGFTSVTGDLFTTSKHGDKQLIVGYSHTHDIFGSGAIVNKSPDAVIYDEQVAIIDREFDIKIKEERKKLFKMLRPELREKLVDEISTFSLCENLGNVDLRTEKAEAIRQMCEDKGISIFTAGSSSLNSYNNFSRSLTDRNVRPAILDFFSEEEITKMHIEACAEEVLSE